jgi:hypothetical protein
MDGTVTSSAASAAAVVAADHHHHHQPWSYSPEDRNRSYPPEDRDNNNNLNKHNLHSTGTLHSTTPGAAESILTGTTYDREHVNLQTLLKFAMLAYKAGQYSQALSLLLKFRARSEARYGGGPQGNPGSSSGVTTVEFDNRDEVLGLLVTTYCRLQEWTQAEEIVRTMEFEGRGEAVKTLVWCYCEEKKWIEGERILTTTQTSTQTATPTERDTDFRDRDRDAESASSLDIETLEMFAEVYRGKGDYDKAIKMCDGILQCVADEEEDEEHIMFYLAISMLGQVYELKGDIIEATLHKDLLPPGIEGPSPRLPPLPSPLSHV